MRTAIIGFSGSGKTDLFHALGGSNVKSNKAVAKVPEPRLEPLIKLFNPKKITYSEIEYTDIQGPINNKTLSEIKGYDCFVAVLDGFSGFNDPEEQWKELESEFILQDLSIIEKRLEKIKKNKKQNEKEIELLTKVKRVLDSEIPLRESSEIFNNNELKSYGFLSAKPVLYVWNVLDENLNDIQVDKNNKLNQVHIGLSAKLEKEIAEITDKQELEEFLEEFGIKEPALNKIIKNTYKLLNLITFLTAGEKEVRAWPLKKGSTAQEAGGVIHSDIKRGFIRAEVLSWEDFEKYGDFKNAKKNGALRLEGKDYIVKDGDIITFYFNV